jgi:hypothetical protein
MRGWVVTLLALFGGYVIVKHFLFRTGNATSISGELSGTTTTGVSPVLGQTQVPGQVVAQQTGVGDFFVSPIASGVPVFNPAAIANGHGDQVAAAYHTNTLATIPGSAQYEPAFGPMTNQNPTNDIYIFG